MVRAQLSVGFSLFVSCIVLMNAHRTTNPFSFTRRMRGGAVSRPALPPAPAVTHGTLFAGPERLKLDAWRRLVSVDAPGETAGAEECTLTVVNDLSEPVTLCWVDFDGRLRNFYVVNDRSIADGSVRNRHDEYTCTGHCFVCFRHAGGAEDARPTHLRELRAERVLFVYAPSAAQGVHTLHLRAHATPPATEKPRWGWSRRSAPAASQAAHPVAVTATFAAEPRDEDGDVVDTTQKRYDEVHVAGFRVCYEPGVFAQVDGLAAALEADLQMLQRLLPPAACRLLQRDTPLWVNAQLAYGPAAAPIDATSCCFHPLGGAAWLRRNGLSEAKEGGVEIGSARHYLRCRRLWGVGGVLVHEFSHAFHNKCLPGGYEHGGLQRRYAEAMRDGLYDCVDVHCHEPGEAPEFDDASDSTPPVRKDRRKAYACANAMEFFAELSTAFLYALDDRAEFNKWFPHNRSQLRLHDPATYALLHQLWHSHD